ncbi:hypothetical protein RND81_03G083800 [Saponaria officinalis]|uniref:Uncharacterized protein n=1 Tax=Saponaria officinalis TaxID=3572 RepID=A0AAW1LZ44_SAPOF
MALIHLRVLFCGSDPVSKEPRKSRGSFLHRAFLFLSFTSSRERYSFSNSCIRFLGKGTRPMGVFSSLPTSSLVLSFFLDEKKKQSILPFLILLLYFWVFGKVYYSADFLREPARLTALVSGACIIFLCFRKRKKRAFLIAFFIYFLASTYIGVISIASAPGGEQISCPIPFLFIFCHLFLFLGLFLFQRNIRVERQPLVPLLFGTLLFFLPDFPNLEWLEGWIEGLDLFLLLLGFLLFVCGEENE